MSSLLARVGGWLVEPSAAERPRAVPRAAARRPADLAVLAAPADAFSLAAALALRLSGSVAVVGVWPAGSAPRRAPWLPCAPASRRVLASLRARGLRATGSGRLVTVSLGGAEEAARLCGAVTDAPVVLALAGARHPGWDGVLAERDLVVVHAREAAVAELALARLGERAVRLDARPAVLAGALARAGLALPGGRASLAPALEAVGR